MASYDEMVTALDEGRALYSAEQTVLMDDAAYPELCRKLREVLESGSYSGKMVAITARLVGKRWTNPEIAGLSISSDGMLTEAFRGELGSASDFDENLRKVVARANLNAPELELLTNLVAATVDRFDGQRWTLDDRPDIELD